MPGSGAPAARPLLEEVYPSTLDCVHCGLCLPACPTYLVTGRESASPRGRVYLMRGVAEGEIELGPNVAEALELCLGCRACESACPSSVRYGHMLDRAREEIALAGLRRGFGAWIERMALRGVIAHRARLHAFVSFLACVQQLRLDRLLAPLLPASLRRAEALLPRIPARVVRRPLPHVTLAQGERRGRVAFFEGCVMSEFFGEANRAAVRVLARNGFEVVVPSGQGCCGALHSHAGDGECARQLARHNAAALRGLEVDACVAASAGCGAILRELEETSSAASAGGRLPPIRDICSWLDERGLRPRERRLQLRVCYDDPCHLLHAQGESEAPRHLLAAIEGLELVPHADAGACCGAAGTYNLTHAEMSHQVLESKLDALQAATPELVASGNPGCLLQLDAGLRQRGLTIRVAHPIEVLDAAERGLPPGSIGQR